MHTKPATSLGMEAVKGPFLASTITAHCHVTYVCIHLYTYIYIYNSFLSGGWAKVVSELSDVDLCM